MRKSTAGFALVDVLALGAVGAVLMAIGIPTLLRARELSKRMACSVNLAGIGAAGSIYASANKGSWMVPAFKNGRIDFIGIGYTAANWISEPGHEVATEVGFDRHRESRSETLYAPSAGSENVSTTRAYWMLVRSGEANVRQFICPSSLNDFVDSTENVELYYDFRQYWNISYGYLVPFGPPDTMPREGMDSRQVIAADKGIFYLRGLIPQYRNGLGQPLEVTSPPSDWRPYNSYNHGGPSAGEGQNALFADGHVAFLRRPTGGVDDDNIYTLMTEAWDSRGTNRIYGETPHQFYRGNPYPGQDVFGTGPGMYSTTDSLIYP